MKERNKAIPVAYLWLERNGKVLMGRRCQTGYMDGMYQFPSGHIEEGELPSQAIIREAKEEVNVDLGSRDIELVHVAYRPKHDVSGDRVGFFFKAKRWSGEVKNMEPEKCDDLRWFSLDELPDNLPPHFRQSLISIQQGIFFEEFTLVWLQEHGLYALY